MALAACAPSVQPGATPNGADAAATTPPERTLSTSRPLTDAEIEAAFGGLAGPLPTELDRSEIDEPAAVAPEPGVPFAREVDDPVEDARARTMAARMTAIDAERQAILAALEGLPEPARTRRLERVLDRLADLPGVLDPSAVSALDPSGEAARCARILAEEGIR